MPTDEPPNHDIKQRTWLADANLFVVAVIWGVNMPIMKFALGRVDEYLFNAVRLTLSAAVLGVLVIAGKRRRQNQIQSTKSSNRHESKDPRRYWRDITIFAFLTGFGYQVLFLLGINETSAGNTALIMSAIPMWTAVLAMWWLKETLNRKAWIGLLVALAGVLTVTLAKPGASATGSLHGNLLVSTAALAWAIGSVVSRPMMQWISPLRLAFYSVAMSVPLHFLVAVHAWDQFHVFWNDPWLTAALVYSGTFSTGIAIAMWNLGVQQLGASHAAGYQNLVPLIALLASWLFISELPYPLQLFGGSLILSGLFVMRRFRG